MSTINIILRKDKIKKTTGKCPLYMRVIEGEKITVISLGQDILEEEWDDKMSPSICWPTINFATSALKVEGILHLRLVA